MSNIIDGKKWALEHEEILLKKLQTLSKKPVLVSFLIGEDPASIRYSGIKQEKASQLGIDFQIARYNQETKFEEILNHITKLNEDPEVDGIMIQLPLPQEFLKFHTEDELIEKINPQKDVDGLRVDSSFLSATVRAILSLINDEQVSLADKHVVIIGAKGEVGKRLVKALKDIALKISEADRQTTNLVEITRGADLLVSSTGQPSLITGDMIKDGVVVIDVGSEILPDGKVAGDVDFTSVAPKASKITPVPHGVGPMTVISLMENVVESVEKRRN